jgi:hypothetical protein
VSNLVKLEADAEAKRLRLEETLRSLEKRATFLGVVDEAIALSGAPRSGEVADVLRRNPVLAIGLALCLGLIALEVRKSRRQGAIGRRNRHGVAQPRNALTPIP